MRKLLKCTLLVCAGVVVAALAAEFTFRLAYPTDGEAAATIARIQRRLAAGHVFRYVPHPYLSYVLAPTPGGPPVNELGFLGPAPWKIPQGARRIVCVGADTTLEHFDALDANLRGTYGDRVALINYALPGWSTAESTLNLLLNASHHRTAAVLIHHAQNDAQPRMAPGFVPDYTHWRRPFVNEVDGLTKTLGRYSQLFLYLKWRGGFRDFGLDQATVPFATPATTDDGRLDPATGRAFATNIHTMVTTCDTMQTRAILVTVPRSPGPATDHIDALTCQAIDEHNAILRRTAADTSAELIDVASRFASRATAFLGRTRLEPEGIREKARVIADGVRALGVLDE